jgi:hypothetical protein
LKGQGIFGGQLTTGMLTGINSPDGGLINAIACIEEEEDPTLAPTHKPNARPG